MLNLLVNSRTRGSMIFCRSFTQKSLESHILVCRVATGISQKRLKKQKVSKKSAVPEKAEALGMTFSLIVLFDLI